MVAGSPGPGSATSTGTTPAGGSPEIPAGGDERIDVSVAEYLDAVAAIRQLRIGRHDREWTEVLAATTTKPTMIDLR